VNSPGLHDTPNTTIVIVGCHQVGNNQPVGNSITHLYHQLLLLDNNSDDHHYLVGLAGRRMVARSQPRPNDIMILYLMIVRMCLVN
jgi:hypothetical protein